MEAFWYAVPISDFGKGGIARALGLFQLLGKRPESFDFRLGASLLGLDSFKLLGKFSQHLGGPLGQSVLLDLFLL